MWCFTKKLCIRHDAWMGMWCWWSCWSPVAHSCGLLNHSSSFCGGMFKLNAKFDADLLLYLLSHFKEAATHYMHSLDSVYRPHWLVQWSHHCSHMCIPLQSPWQPDDIDVMQTILIILTMAGLFPGRPHNTPQNTIGKMIFIILPLFIDDETELQTNYIICLSSYN